ncbi:hypothetical protein [Gordonia humi]|uniref:Uncharacterized protein n=1 Tax=Gordonia humi TaxID=686429 RepID=A0A840F3Q4_9ACTN|nr:hypothetical protein [Gordonia humi]MBB4136069.1 hypothetical protein [Gordonia humi]
MAGQPILTGVFVAVLLPVFGMRVFWPSDVHRGTITLSTILTVVLLVTMAVSMTITFDNPWTIVGAVAVFAVIIVLRGWWRTGLVHDVLVTVSRRAGLIVAVGVLVLAAVNDAPWMGQERIRTDDGVIDGYVLEAEPGFLHVLTTDRDVIIVPDSAVVDRELVD